jgi:hypothetical protein
MQQHNPLSVGTTENIEWFAAQFQVHVEQMHPVEVAIEDEDYLV